MRRGTATPHESRGRRLLDRHRFTMAFAAAMAASNVLGYGSILLVSVALRPADFGAVAALTSVGVIVSVPAGALQVLVAGRHGRGRSTHSAYALAALVGLAMAALLMLVSPALKHSFELSSVWPVVWLAATVLPVTLASVQQGTLLGANLLGRLSLLLLFFGVTRVVASAWLAIAGLGTTGAIAGWAIATWLTLGLGHWLVRREVVTQLDWPSVRSLARVLGLSSVTFGALIVLTSADTIAARHFLTAYDSGLYGVASMFAKVIFWGTQFVAMVVVPRITTRSGSRLVLRAYGAVLVIAAPVIVVLAAAPTFWLSVLGLSSYRQASSLLVGFGVLGVLWALIQVSAFADIGRQRATMTTALWTGLVVQLVVTALWWHSSAREIWLAATAGALAVLIVAWLPAIATRARARVTRAPSVLLDRP